MVNIRINNLRKSYDDQVVLNDLDLEVNVGEFVVLLGASGCGKTTLLKSLNKLIPIDSGDVYIRGKKLEEWDTIELRQSIGYVIQQIGLFPHLNIEENIGYVLSLMKTSKVDAYPKVKELIELVGMDESFLKRYPHELSGGQRQRVGVARALAADPDIILMDEPFGAVDEIARTTLQDEFKALQKKLNKTVIFVTHDIHEAMKLGTKIVLMNNGKIEQIGTPEELQFSPESDYVKNFLGLKGLQSFFDEEKLNQVYEDILNKKMTVEDLFKHL
jgi:osmoprotectant transport system ATP-binding protein